MADRGSNSHHGAYPGSVNADAWMPEQVARSRSRPHGWFAVIWMIYLIDYADRFAISAVLPAIQDEFSLTDTQLGLMSGSLFLGLALLAVPCGLAVDRFSRKYMISAMTLVWSLATWATGMARSFEGLVVARILVGAGEAGYNPAGYALIAAWYPERLRGTMVGLFNMAQPLGIGLGIMLAGHLAASFGWRAVFGVLAVPGIVLAVAMLFAPDYRTRKRDHRGAETVKPGLRGTVGFIVGKALRGEHAAMNGNVKARHAKGPGVKSDRCVGVVHGDLGIGSLFIHRTEGHLTLARPGHADLEAGIVAELEQPRVGINRGVIEREPVAKPVAKPVAEPVAELGPHRVQRCGPARNKGPSGSSFCAFIQALKRTGIQ